MKKIILAIALCGGTTAHAATINTANWEFAAAPSLPTHTPYLANALKSTNSWESEEDNSAYNRNGNGALVSDFAVTDNYEFSGTATPTTGAYVDDDVLGIVFGWTDESNHIRMGFEGGGSYDRGNTTAFANGFWIVEEIGGVSTKLYEDTNFTFALGTTYGFSVSVVSGAVSFSFGDVSGTNQIVGTIDPAASVAGKVGIYTESQTGAFANLSVTDIAPPSPARRLAAQATSQTSPIPLPAGLPLILAGLGAFGVVRRMQR